MRGKIVIVGLILALTGMAVPAQEKAAVAIANDLYCSGVITSENVPRDTILITGEQSYYKLTFQEGDYAYINKGSNQGVKAGDVFSVIRPVKDSIEVEWTKWQNSIFRKMGTDWEDEGRLRVVLAHPDVSIAQVEHSCDYLQRGDLVVPFTERQSPPIKPASQFDRFAPPSGKQMAMVIVGRKFQQQLGTNDVAYVNLGRDQGVKVGDYFRIFRYQGTQHEDAFQTPRFAFDIEGKWGPTLGFGSSPSKYNWNNVPREVIGEGVVVRTGTNSSTVLLTFALREIYSGDYVEIE
jgi:hypothetical protein